jgi:hypothetical protein
MIARSVLVPVVGVTAAVLAWTAGTKYVGQAGATPLERAVIAARQAPMVKAVLADHPDLEASLRATIEVSLRVVRPGQSPDISDWTTVVWRQYFAPTLGNADDAPLLRLSAGLREFLTYLQNHEPERCHALGNLSRFENLSHAARVAGQRLPMAFVEAYRSGVAHQPVRPRPSAGEVERIVSEGRVDVAGLDRFDKLQAVDRCVAMIRLLAALERLPPDRGATVLRYLVTAGS